MASSQLVLEFVHVIKELSEESLLTKEMIVRHDKANEKNLHSRLQGALIKAADQCGFSAFPEEKVRLKKPITGGKRAQRNYRADVAFYRNGERVGMCEVITMDMLTHLYPTRELKRIYPETQWLTTATKLLQISRELRGLELFLLVVMPEIAERTPSYRDFRAITGGSRNLLEKFSPALSKLCKTLKKSVDVTSIIITENGVFFENGLEQIDFG